MPEETIRLDNHSVRLSRAGIVLAGTPERDMGGLFGCHVAIALARSRTVDVPENAPTSLEPRHFVELFSWRRPSVPTASGGTFELSWQLFEVQGKEMMPRLPFDIMLATSSSIPQGLASTRRRGWSDATHGALGARAVARRRRAAEARVDHAPRPEGGAMIARCWPSLLFAVAVSLLNPSAMEACSCPSSGPPCQAACSADAIFSGTVRSIDVSEEVNGDHRRVLETVVRFDVDRAGLRP
jgi:hypothetical protein